METKAIKIKRNRHAKIKRDTSIFQSIATVLGTILLFAECLSVLLPVVWLVYSSFKPLSEFYMDIWALPRELKFTNYSRVFEILKITKTTIKGVKQFTIFDMLGTSFMFTIIPTVIGSLPVVICGYVLGKFTFPGCKFLYAFGIFLMITPIISTGAAGLKIAKSFNLYDNPVPNWFLAFQGGFSGVHFLMFYALFKNIPTSYAEAAMVDGASNFRIFTQIMFPMATPTWMCVMALNFIGGWNDYTSFLLYYPSYANLAYGVYYFEAYAQYFNATRTEVFAGFVICMVPSVIVYLLADRFVLNKFTVGGLKG